MSGKWFGLIVVAIIGILLGGGFKLVQTFNPFAGTAFQQKPPSVELKSPIESKLTESTAPESETPKTPKTSISEAIPDQGEIVVEGMVDSISIKKRTIKFTQEMDDSSKKVNPRIKVLPDAVVEVNGKQTEFDQIMVGDYVTMILNQDRLARAVQVDR